MSDLINVVCAVIRNNGKILVARCSAEMSLPLKWEFPGGKVEEGENEKEALHREIMEELNISIRIEQRLSTVLEKHELFSINLIPYLAEYVSGKIILEEHCECRFVELSEREDLDWAAADIPVVRAVLELV